MRSLAELTPAALASASEEIVLRPPSDMLPNTRRYTASRATVASGMALPSDTALQTGGMDGHFSTLS
ncbi:MAG: hypothetical protein WKF47_17835 [Geodermatophilaceae bacterium]